MTVAIIGTGWGARIQVPAFRAAGLNVSVLVGSNTAKTERIAGELGVPTALDDWRAALTRDDVQLVSIVTPPNLHGEMAVAALEAGKHVLCEKPTALDKAEAEAMLAAAQAHPHLLALIDHELRFLPSFLLARQMIADGAIGTVRSARGQAIGSGRSDPNREWNWWADETQGGGILGAVGSHYLDMLRYLLGTEVTSVSAALRTHIAQRPYNGELRAVTADDAYSLRAELANGALATLEADVTARVSEPDGLTIYGSEGVLRHQNGEFFHAKPGGPFENITPAHLYPIPSELSGAFPVATVYIGHALRAFLDGDTSAAAPGATFTDGLHIQAALDATRQSSREARTVTI